MQQPTTSYPASRRRGFTLVELLVVVAIMGLIFGVMLPAFTGMGRGQSMRSATAQLRSTVALARQWAITHREKTYVIFPDDATTYNPKAYAAMALRAYGVWGEKSGYIREWTYLPQGLIFNADATNYSNLFTPDYGVQPSVDARIYKVRFPTDTSPAVDMFCLAFIPNGRLDQAGGYEVGVYIVEGWVDADTNAGTVSATTIKPNASYTYGVSCVPLTGQARVRELFF